MASKKEEKKIKLLEGYGISDDPKKQGSSGIGFLEDAVDAATGESAARAAQTQEDAAKKASSEGIQYLKEGAEQGYGFIDTGTDIAGRELTFAKDDALKALGAGQESSLAALYQGQGQAADALGGSPNRLADLYNGGLASGFETDPGYQFRLQQGQDAIMGNFSARGGRGGGDAMKAIMEHGQNFASNEFGNYANRQMGMAQGADQSDFARNASLANLYSGTGSQAAGLHSGYGQNVAGTHTGIGSSLANLYSGAGTNKANLAIGAAGQSANLGMAPVPYAGGADQARANAWGGLLSIGGSIGAAYAGGYAGRPV